MGIHRSLENKYGRGFVTSKKEPTSYTRLSINNSCAGGKVRNSDWPIKTHNPKSKILKSHQINIAKTNFGAFQQYFAKQQTSNYHSPAKLLSKNHLSFTRSTQEQIGPRKAEMERNTFNFPVTHNYKLTIA